MSADPKQAVLARLNELREALSREPSSDIVVKARHQCDRLEQGLSLAHPEAIRFAAYTLLKMLDATSSLRSDAITSAREGLKAALEAERFQH